MHLPTDYLKAAIEALTTAQGGQVPQLRTGPDCPVAQNWLRVAEQALKLALADAKTEREQVAAAVDYVAGLEPLPAARPTEQLARELLSAVAERHGRSPGIGAQLRLGHVPSFTHEDWYQLAVEGIERALLGGKPTQDLSAGQKGMLTFYPLEPLSTPKAKSLLEAAAEAEQLTFYSMATAPTDGTTVLLEVEPNVVCAGHWDATFSLANLGEEFGFVEVGAWTDGSMASVSCQEYNWFANPRRWAPMPSGRPAVVRLSAVTALGVWPERSGWLPRARLPEELTGEVPIRAYAPESDQLAAAGEKAGEHTISVEVFRAQPAMYSHWLPSAT